MSGVGREFGEEASLATLRAEVERLWGELADATAAAARAGLIPTGAQPRADLDTAQSALAHALRELRVGEGRSAVGRSSGSESEPAPSLREVRERLAGWRSSLEQMDAGEWDGYVQRAVAAEDAMGEHGPPAGAGAGEADTRSAPPPQRDAPRGVAWGDRLRAVAWQLVVLNQGLMDAGEVDPRSAEWAPLTAAADLIESVADGLDALPRADAVPTGATGDATVLVGHDAAAGEMPDHPSIDAEQTANAERAALVAALRPRIHAALEEAVAGLSISELRALAAHPDATAALILLVGLAARGELLDPEVTQEEAESSLADLGVTPAVIRHLIVEGILPARPRRSDLMALPVGEVLAACRTVDSSVDVRVHIEPKI